MAYKNINNIIINTSVMLFTENGYSKVSVNEICSACSITKPTLYYHFKSKDDILYQYFTMMLDGISTDQICKMTSPINRIINSYELVFEAYISKGYDLTQNYIACCLKDISKNVYFPAAVAKYVLSAINNGKRKGVIEKGIENEQMLDAMNALLTGHLVLWCQNNGLVDSGLISNSLKLLLHAH